MAFCFKNTNKDNFRTEKDEELYRNTIFCTSGGKQRIVDKVRDHYHLTRNYRGPAHTECNINVTEKQSNFLLFVFPNLTNYDCHIFFTKAS